MTSQAKQPIIRVIVVDDSAFMRKALSMMLEADPSIKVVATARDGEEGVEKIRHLKPDLVTMDIEMPRMDGLTALREIMSTTPVPVMMVSSLTTDGAEATLDALELGAVDFIPKQLSYVSLDIVKIKEDLLAKIKNIVKRKSILMARYQTRAAFIKSHSQRTNTVSSSQRYSSNNKVIGKRNHPISIVAIGSSTGGPPALQEVITKLPRNFPTGIVIAQHMPATFTKSLAERLDSLSRLTVREAVNGEPIEAGTVLIAPGGRQMTVSKVGSQGVVKISDQPADALYKPCVDVMTNSVADAFGRTAMGVVLTGMGNNGVIGLAKMKEKGGIVIAQNEETCVVYGMPRAVIEVHIPDHIASIENIASEIVSYF